MFRKCVLEVQNRGFKSWSGISAPFLLEVDMVVSAGHDENGKYRNGAAGDQTGTEYYKRAWYKRANNAKGGWDYVLRYPNSAVGAKIAEIAEKAAANDCIGYDMNQRNGFYTQMKACNWHPENIKTKCETDCSASTCVTVIAAGHQMSIKALQNISPFLTTWGIKDAFVKAGFTALSDAKYCGSPDYLLKGDIILSTDHHVVINVDNGSKVVTAQTAASKVFTGGTKVTQYAGVVNVSDYLNVRSGPSTSYGMVTIGTGTDASPMRLPNGMVVSIEKESANWGKLTNVDGWVSLKYIKK